MPALLSLITILTSLCIFINDNIFVFENIGVPLLSLFIMEKRWDIHQANTPLLYSKTGVYRSIHFFLFLL